jgi:hypothetical protein
MYVECMETVYRWDIEENAKLIRGRGLSFEMITKSIEDGKRPPSPKNQ